MASWLQKIKERLSIGYGSHNEATVLYEWCCGLLAAYAFESRLTVLTGHVKGALFDENYAAFADKVKSFGHLAFRNVGGKIDNSLLVVSESSVLLLSYSSGEYWVGINTIDQGVMDKFRNDLGKDLVERKQGTAYAIAQVHGNYDLTAIGTASVPLLRENYEENVIKAYDHIIADLKLREPSGRLSIIDGPAGTGKTHLIRGIMHDAVNCVYILMPPNFITELSGPSLIPLLNETREWDNKNKDRSIVIIIEDADACLVPRDDGNMSAISSLLNYTDGIFGSLFDLRVIATTNAKHMDIEKALLRSGRLSRQITVGMLSAETATSVYRRITKDENFKFTTPQILADVYALAKGFEETGKEKSKPTLGFST